MPQSLTLNAPVMLNGTIKQHHTLPPQLHLAITFPMQQKPQQRCLTTRFRSTRLSQLHAGNTNEAAATRSSRVDPLKADEVFYFAFGSNMNPTVLTGRRMVQPRESLPCYVPGYELSFGAQGLPYAEPGFATIVKLPQQHQQRVQQQRQQQSGQQGCAHVPQKEQQQQLQQRRQQNTGAGSLAPHVHGVLHRITQREWEHVKATEGVGSRDVGYQVITVDCHLYDGSTAVKALTLQTAETSMHNTARRVLPSERYLNLLREGARYHKLDQQYQQWLTSLQPYQQNSIQRMVGAAASGAVFLAAAAPAVPAYVAGRAMGLVPGPEASRSDVLLQKLLQRTPTTSTSSSSITAASSNSETTTISSSMDSADSSSGGFIPFMSWYINQAQNWTWFVHDTALAPVLGSGCSNDAEVQS